MPAEMFTVEVLKDEEALTKRKKIISLVNKVPKSDGKNQGVAGRDGVCVDWLRECELTTEQQATFNPSLYPDDKKYFVKGADDPIEYFAEGWVGDSIQEMLRTGLIPADRAECFSPATPVAFASGQGFGLLQPCAPSGYRELFKLQDPEQKQKNNAAEMFYRYWNKTGYEYALEHGQPLGLSYIFMIQMGIFANFSVHSGNLMVNPTEDGILHWKIIDYGAAGRSAGSSAHIIGQHGGNPFISLEEAELTITIYKKYTRYFKNMRGLFQHVVEHAKTFLADSNNKKTLKKIFKDTVKRQLDVYKRYTHNPANPAEWLEKRADLMRYYYGGHSSVDVEKLIAYLSADGKNWPEKRAKLIRHLYHGQSKDKINAEIKKANAMERLTEDALTADQDKYAALLLSNMLYTSAMTRLTAMTTWVPSASWEDDDSKTHVYESAHKSVASKEQDSKTVVSSELSLDSAMTSNETTFAMTPVRERPISGLTEDATDEEFGIDDHDILYRPSDKKEIFKHYSPSPCKVAVPFISEPVITSFKSVIYAFLQEYKNDDIYTDNNGIVDADNYEKIFEEARTSKPRDNANRINGWITQLSEVHDSLASLEELLYALEKIPTGYDDEDLMPFDAFFAGAKLGFEQAKKSADYESLITACEKAIERIQQTKHESFASSAMSSITMSPMLESGLFGATGGRVFPPNTPGTPGDASTSSINRMTAISWGQSPTKVKEYFSGNESGEDEANESDLKRAPSPLS